jgi:hypothetical protein
MPKNAAVATIGFFPDKKARAITCFFLICLANIECDNERPDHEGSVTI